MYVSVCRYLHVSLCVLCKDKYVFSTAETIFLSASL